MAEVCSPVEVLRGPNSRIWPMQLVKVIEDTKTNMCLDIGWESFVKENYLADGEIMFVYYAGNKIFYVRVFSPAMVERLASIEPLQKDEDI